MLLHIMHILVGGDDVMVFIVQSLHNMFSARALLPPLVMGSPVFTFGRPLLHLLYLAGEAADQPHHLTELLVGWSNVTHI